MFTNISIPNCVPEYYRSQFEDEAHEAELEMQRHERYEKNREYRKQKCAEGWQELAFYPDECDHCKHGEIAMPTSEDDDWPVVLCSNWKNCPVFKKEMDEKFPNNTSEDEDGWPKWLLEHEEMCRKEIENG